MKKFLCILLVISTMFMLCATPVYAATQPPASYSNADRNQKQIVRTGEGVTKDGIPYTFVDTLIPIGGATKGIVHFYIYRNVTSGPFLNYAQAAGYVPPASIYWSEPMGGASNAVGILHLQWANVTGTYYNRAYYEGTVSMPL